ncbi:uncharacterized protein LOC124912760 [Impatiens glandulifera]|uniref:uncharacterized protein LOC124912760 n=1 Tax=Impatiens glandulifera TaxID=253017 RepID=UPI001FB0E4BD|nr:uncharacterized protein LOC124912760 [Impatiens glandulifera]
MGIKVPGLNRLSPQHLTIKMSFSLMLKSSLQEYISDQFQVGDYKWKLHMHRDAEGEGCISLYLEMVDTSFFDIGWSVNAVIKFFVLDQNTNKYYTTPGPDSVVRFHMLRKRSGIDRFIDLPTFELSSNGYLVDDKCVFGAEVFLIKQTSKVEMLILQDEDSSFTASHIWKIKSFSSRPLERFVSEIFIWGDFKWRIGLFPVGNGVSKGNSITVYLSLDESTLPKNSRVYAKYKICLLNKEESDNIDFIGYKYFTALVPYSGIIKLFVLDEFLDVEKGFLVDNLWSIEVKVTILGVVNTIA